MSALLHLAVTGLLCIAAIPLLARAQWPIRAPRTAIMLWQSITLTLVLCAIGTLFAWGLEPYPGSLTDGFALALSDFLAGEPTRVLDGPRVTALAAGIVATSAVVTAAAVTCAALERTRRRHRRLIDLVGREDPVAPGAEVLEHAAPVAYCVPGLRPRLVISTGALRLLDDQQIRAVLAHERAHARARHDLVLLPFVFLQRLVPRRGLLAQATGAVAALIEMCADDRASRQTPPRSLATALVHMSAPPSGLAGTLNISDGATRTRVTRLLAPHRPLGNSAKFLALICAATLVSTPLSFLLFPA